MGRSLHARRDAGSRGPAARPAASAARGDGVRALSRRRRVHPRADRALVARAARRGHGATGRDRARHARHVCARDAADEGLLVRRAAARGVVRARGPTGGRRHRSRCSPCSCRVLCRSSSSGCRSCRSRTSTRRCSPRSCCGRCSRPSIAIPLRSSARESADDGASCERTRSRSAQREAQRHSVGGRQERGGETLLALIHATRVDERLDRAR